MKQTAVEFFYLAIYDNFEINGSEEMFNRLIDQAKEMEKQQIIDAIAQYQIKHNKIFSEQGILNVVNKAKQYYNEKFKNK